MTQAQEDVVGLVRTLVEQLVDTPESVEVTGRESDNGDL